MRTRTNAGQVARKVARLRAGLARATTAGLRAAVVAVDRQQTENLRGGSAAVGSFPVPQRRGHLLRSTFWDMPSPTRAIAGNTAVYAHSVHEGTHRQASHGRRPFLHLAVEQAQPAKAMAVTYGREIRRAFA